MFIPIQSELRFFVGQQHNVFMLKEEHNSIVLFDWEGRVASYPLDFSAAAEIAAEIVGYIIEHTPRMTPEEMHKVATTAASFIITFVETASKIRNIS